MLRLRLDAVWMLLAQNKIQNPRIQDTFRPRVEVREPLLGFVQLCIKDSSSLMICLWWRRRLLKTGGTQVTCQLESYLKQTQPETRGAACDTRTWPVTHKHQQTQPAQINHGEQTQIESRIEPEDHELGSKVSRSTDSGQGFSRHCQGSGPARHLSAEVLASRESLESKGLGSRVQELEAWVDVLGSCLRAWVEIVVKSRPKFEDVRSGGAEVLGSGDYHRVELLVGFE
eukprot:1332759-Rhodomonas_salina.1